jgi:hypothetical protein
LVRNHLYANTPASIARYICFLNVKLYYFLLLFFCS